MLGIWSSYFLSLSLPLFLPPSISLRTSGVYAEEDAREDFFVHSCQPQGRFSL